MLPGPQQVEQHEESLNHRDNPKRSTNAREESVIRSNDNMSDPIVFNQWFYTRRPLLYLHRFPLRLQGFESAFGCWLHLSRCLVDVVITHDVILSAQ